MQLNVTIELIPTSRRYPKQGTIMGDVINISKKRVEVALHPNLTNTFFDIGDNVPIIIRSHIHEEIEIESEATVLDITEVEKNSSSMLLEIKGDPKDISVVEDILLKVNDDNEIVYAFQSRIN